MTEKEELVKHKTYNTKKITKLGSLTKDKLFKWYHLGKHVLKI